MKKYLSRLTAVLLALVLLVAPASALTVDEALGLLEDYYYYDIPDEAYGAETMDELFALLDPYTDYFTEEEYKAFLGLIEGDMDLVGIGVSIQYTQKGILVVEAFSGGSAGEAGLRAGDLIVEVDGTSCVPADAGSGALITGEEGTRVTITVLRDGVTTRHTLTRRPVVVPNAEIRLLDGGVGYIDCNSFGQDTGNEVAQMVAGYDSQVTLWVLDLRGNTGGYTDAAVEMLNVLMGPGYYIYFEDGTGGVSGDAGIRRAATAKPVVVLTDGGSASASELVASNIRDLGRGVTVGGRTYGKGVAQVVLDSDSMPRYFDGDGMKITVYRFYSGGMNTTDTIGVIPTLLVDDGQAAAVALALCGDFDESYMSIQIGAPYTQGGRRSYYVDPDTDADTLSALLSALPPQIAVGYSDVAGWRQDIYTPAQLAELLGIEYENRWFTDVADSKYAKAINAMGAYELLVGDGKGSFNPKGQLTRAQLCAMLAQVLGVDYTGGSRFTDVESGAWYHDAVNAIAALGLVEGTGSGKFTPDGPLTQEQFLTVMGRTARFLNLKVDNYGQWLEEYGDRLTMYRQPALTPYSDWAKNSIAVLAWGLEEAFDDTWNLGMLYAPLTELSPKAPILREEAAAGMYAVLAGLGILPREAM